MSRIRVAMGSVPPSYLERPPYHPDERFPEAVFSVCSTEPNPPYRLFRELLRDLGFDAPRFGTAEWNPLGHLVRPGDTVVLKPNFVISRNLGGGPLQAVVTHPSLLRAAADYVFKALQGKGRLIIADAPQMDCDWEELMRFMQLPVLQEFYRQQAGFEVEAYDLRNFAVVDNTRPPYAHNRKFLRGDPAGSTIVNLGSQSAFYGLDSARYYGADYDRAETIRHHHGEVHEYSISNTILEADVIISLPKMKTHKKVGVTLNLKGLVGINTNKNYLIHYRLGSPRTGGDQIPDTRETGRQWKHRIQRWLSDHTLARQTVWGAGLYAAAKAVWRKGLKRFVVKPESGEIIDAGNWFFNDSAWRMTADLAKILFFADKKGVLRDRVQRRLFCVVDGIIGGEGRGPLEPRAKPAGYLVAGENPVAVDLVTCRLMGFDPAKIRQFDVLKDRRWDFGFTAPEDVEVLQDGQVVSGRRFFDPANTDRMADFEPHPGWKGHVEINAPPIHSRTRLGRDDPPGRP